MFSEKEEGTENYNPIVLQPKEKDKHDETGRCVVKIPDYKHVMECYTYNCNDNLIELEYSNFYKKWNTVFTRV